MVVIRGHKTLGIRWLFWYLFSFKIHYALIVNSALIPKHFISPNRWQQSHFW
jgi:hypothetical protein